MPIGDVRIKLQVRSDGENGRGWQDHFRLTEIEGLKHLTRIHIIPGDWGVYEDCIVVLHDVLRQTVLLRQNVKGGETLDTVCDIEPTVQRLRLSFFAVSDPAEQEPLVRPVRYYPPKYVGKLPEEVRSSDGRHEYTIRRDVVVSPIDVIRARPWYKYEGVMTVSVDGSAVVEAMEFALGRQSYLFARPREFVECHDSVVYLGPSHPSYGHFLTQSLSRAWYAMRNPEVPIVWQGGLQAGLRPYQREILDLLGIRNPVVLLDEPTRFREVVFPFPLMSIGDYLLPEFASFVGCVPSHSTVRGKKLFLSRSKLDLGRGAVIGGDHLLDDVMEKHGYVIFHPQEHSLAHQLNEISSSEVVAGVEGSAMHSVLLLKDPVRTKFWAIARHHGGGGVFEHVKAAKPGLWYETLSFSDRRPNSARESLDLDLAMLDRKLAETDGFTTNLDALGDHIQKPRARQTSFRAQMSNCKSDLSPFESDMVTAFLAVRKGDTRTAELAIGNWL